MRQRCLSPAQRSRTCTRNFTLQNGAETGPRPPEDMPYPKSPFGDDFRVDVLHANDSATKVPECLKIAELLEWLCMSPRCSSYRVNTLLHDVNVIFEAIQEEVIRLSQKLDVPTPKVYVHGELRDVVVVENYDPVLTKLTERQHQVIVDARCGAAVLRGAHIYAPGVIGMTSGVKVGEEVSIFVDAKRKCKRGFQKVYEDDGKVFVGNGVARMARHMLFGENLNLSGVAVEILHNTSGCLPLTESFLPNGTVLLQNLPSVIAVDILNPQPGERILDMCAAPGNKTVHIAAKIKNQGFLVAVDKTPAKVEQLKATCERFNAEVVLHHEDSTKLSLYPPESFDRILLDAPCSALGKRPQICNGDSEKMIRSHVPVQKKLFENAVKLLKVDGVLVYSTCTVTVAENEGLVAWALKTFKCLELRKCEPCFGEDGWSGVGLTDEQVGMVRRFGPNCLDIDSIGFFIAKFVKIKSQC